MEDLLMKEPKNRGANNFLSKNQAFKKSRSFEIRCTLNCSAKIDALPSSSQSSSWKLSYKEIENFFNCKFVSD